MNFLLFIKFNCQIFTQEDAYTATMTYATLKFKLNLTFELHVRTPSCMCFKVSIHEN